MVSGDELHEAVSIDVPTRCLSTPRTDRLGELSHPMKRWTWPTIQGDQLLRNRVRRHDWVHYGGKSSDRQVLRS